MRPCKTLFAARIMGINIRRIRKARGLRVAELAAAMGVVIQSWYKWERGEVLPNEFNQIQIAECLRVDMEELRRGCDMGSDVDAAKSQSRLSGAMSGRDMPVTGLAPFGDCGWYMRTKLGLRAPVERDYDHPGRLFAVLALGTDMEPDGIRSGYLLYCDALLEPESGDAVFVALRDGRVAVRRFVRQDEHRLVVQCWLAADKHGQQAASLFEVERPEVDSVACVVVVRRR